MPRGALRRLYEENMRTMLREQQLVASAYYEMATELERLRHGDAEAEGPRGAPRMLLD